MHVGFLTHLLSSQGAGLQSAMLGLSTALCDNGHKVSVFGVADESYAGEANLWAHTQCRPEPAKGPLALGYHPNMRQALLSASPSVIHQHGLWTYSSVLGAQWGAKNSQNRLVSPHGMLDPWALTQSAVKKKLALALYEKRGLQSAGCLHALTLEEADSIRALGIQTPICVIPNGVQVPELHTYERLEHPQIGERPYLLFLSRIHPKKNLQALVDAWAALEENQENGELQLILAGWGSPEHEAELNESIARLGLRHCHFIGKVMGQAKEQLYANAHGFILPSLSEGLPMVVLEAWAHGVPVMMSQACNLPLGFEKNAALQCATDTEDLIKDLRLFVSMSDHDKKTMAHNGQQLIHDYYRWPVISQRFAEIYQWLLSRENPPEHLLFKQ